MINTFDLQHFAGVGDAINVTGGVVNSNTGTLTASNAMSPTLKTYYDTELLENARPNLFYAQFGKKQGLPANHGRTVEWRKFNTLPNATQLTEGVIPTGEPFGVTDMTVPLAQYGMYVAVSDVLDTHAVDNIILGAVEELGASMGNTQDILVRNTLMEGTSVIYADILADDGTVTPVESRANLTAKATLTPTIVNRAATFLRKMNAHTVNGKYIGIVHPSVTYDLRQSAEWIEVHKYAGAREIYTGEIGELHGVRFVESTNAAVIAPAHIGGDDRIPVRTHAAEAVNAATTVKILDAISIAAASAVNADIKAGASYEVYVNGTKATVTSVKAGSNGSASITLATAVTAAVGDVICGVGAGADGSAVYATLIMGKDAFGIIDPDGGAAQMITKTRGEIGGPLEQFSTVGYKFETAAKILYEERMVRVESGSYYSAEDEGNY